MAISIVVGGQYGSEGKGKIAHFLARDRQAAVAVRVGGANSGHTVYDDVGRKFIFQHLPTAAVLPDIGCVLPAGSYIDVSCLMREIDEVGLDKARLKIDPNAVVVTEQYKIAEQLVGLRAGIGSTQTGTGAAVAARVSRTQEICFARDEAKLAPFLHDTKSYLRNLLSRNERVVIEGTQGYGLSVLHTPHYPFATSRDTTAAGFLSEVGLSPIDVDEVVLVVRAFPIRVPGNSGPLERECSWDEITAEANAPSRLEEFTSVTRSVRRVARFSPEIVRQAIASNRPTLVVLNHADYWDAGCRGHMASARVRRAVAEIEASIGRQIDLLGTSERCVLPYRHLLLQGAA